MITEEILRDNLTWEKQRSSIILGMICVLLILRESSCLDQMVGSGQLWLDSQGSNGYKEYWAPSIFTSTLVSG